MGLSNVAALGAAPQHDIIFILLSYLLTLVLREFVTNTMGKVMN